MITRSSKKKQTESTPTSSSKSISRSKKNESTLQKQSSIDEIDAFLEKLMLQLTIEPITESCDEMRATIPISYTDIPSVEKPKAIFIAGPPGSGKTFLMNQLLPSKFKYALYNADIYQEHLLKVNGLLGNKERETAIYNELKAENPKATEEVLNKLMQSRIASIIATSMAISQKCIREDFDEMIDKKFPIVIDRPADHSSTVLEDKKRLEKMGYQVMMIMVYVSPLTALKRNKIRDRNVYPARVLDSWIGCMENIATYKKSFKQNFFMIQNDSGPFEINPTDLESYIPYTSQIQKYISLIEPLMKKEIKLSSLDTIRSYIQEFLEQKGGKRKSEVLNKNTKRLKIKNDINSK